MRPNQLRLFQLRQSHLPIAIILVLTLLLGACGSGNGEGGDDGAAGDNSASGSGEGSGSSQGAGPGSNTDSGSGSNSGGGENGSIRFEIGGNWDTEGEFLFIPQASTYIDGNWSLSFAPNQDGSGDAIVTILLAPESFYFTYGDTEFTVGGGADQCEFDIDQNGVAGASGTIECANLTGVPAASSMRDGVSFSATFDART